MTATLIGYRVAKSKKSNTDYCQMFLVVPANERDFSSGMVGDKTQVEFLPNSQIGYLKPSDIGKEIQLDYEIVGNRAYLVNVSVLPDKKAV